MPFKEKRRNPPKEPALNCFTLKESGNSKKLKLFFEVYKEDYKENIKKGKPLSRKEEERAERLAKEIIEEEEKQVFVATAREKKGEVPVGFIIFWTEFHGHMHSSDMVFHSDRVFIRKEFREQGLGSEMILRSCCKVLEEFPTLAYACFCDPFQSPLCFVLESMKSKGLINELHKRTSENDFFVELNHDALLEQAESIDSSECFKTEENRKKPH